MTTLTIESRGADGVAEVIAGLGDSVVFGLPGGHMSQVLNGLRDRTDEVQCVLVREESIATVMGEAFGRLAGRPAFAIAQGAWVLGAGGIGVMEAHLGSSPLVVLIDATEGGSYSHHGPYQGGLGGYGAYDLAGAMRTITKQTFLALDPVQAVQMTQLAVKHALDGEPGPVAVVFHSRALLSTFSEAELRRLHFDHDLSVPPTVASEGSIRSAAAAIDASSRPVIIAGNGLRSARAQQALLSLAVNTGIPVATTASGKGVFPESNDLAVGSIGGYGQDSANTLVGASDLVIAIGTKLGATDTIDEHPGLIDVRRQSIVQIDPETLNIGWTFPVAHPIAGRAEDVVPRLESALRTTFDGVDRVRDVRARKGYFTLPEDVRRAEGAVNPRRLANLLAGLLPPASTVACDAGENRIFMLHDFEVPEGGTLIQPNGGGGMGYAVPAAVAAGYADPSRLPVAIVGDGGFSMSLHSLMTAVENRRRLVVVLMDNQALGWVLHGQKDRPFLSSFAPFDYAAIAKAIGCDVETVTSEDALAPAIARATAGTGVSVVVAKTDLAESFITIKSELAGLSHEELIDAEPAELVATGG